MPSAPTLSTNELQRFHRVAARSMEVRTHRDMLQWLQGDVQLYLPHNIMIAVWGDFATGRIQHDVISALDGARSRSSNLTAIKPLVLDWFNCWTALAGKPFTLNAGTDGFAGEEHANPRTLLRALQKMRCAMVHGIQDARGNFDCLYVALSDKDSFDESAHQLMAMLLPYIDVALRRVTLLPEQIQHLSTTGPTALQLAQAYKLSSRELEILQWVTVGKTNPEIGDILKISAFTVKNHLQRIFKKLDVTNRAQAVGKLRTSDDHASGP